MAELSPHQRLGPCELCQQGASENQHCAWCGHTEAEFGKFIAHISGPCGAKMADQMMRYYDKNKDERDRRRNYRRPRHSRRRH